MTIHKMIVRFVCALLALVAITVPVVTVAAAGGTTLEVNGGATISLATGDKKYTIPIVLNNIPSAGVGAFNFDINWDPSSVQVDVLNPGSLGTFTVLTGNPDNTAGTVLVAGYSDGKTFLSGKVTLATLDITMIGSGAGSAIAVADISVGDAAGNMIDVTAVNAPVQVKAAGSTTSFSLTVSVNGQGNTMPNGTQSLPAGTVVDISASPAAGWIFTGWIGPVADPNSAATKITMDDNKSITANFIKTSATYSVTIKINGSGTITPAPGVLTYASGATINLTATANPGWTFTGWSGAITDSKPNATYTVTSDATLTANFVQTPAGTPTPTPTVTQPTVTPTVTPVVTPTPGAPTPSVTPKPSPTPAPGTSSGGLGGWLYVIIVGGVIVLGVIIWFVVKLVGNMSYRV